MSKIDHFRNLREKKIVPGFLLIGFEILITFSNCSALSNSMPVELE